MLLGDLVTLRRGTTYKSSLLGQPGPVLLGLASIQRNGGFRNDSLRTYGGESPAKLILGPGDLYVSLKDVTQAGDLLGAVSRVPAPVSAGRLTQDTVRLQLRDGAPSADYLYWLLRTPQYRDYCRARSIGTTNLSLSREDFLAFPVPPLTDARRSLVAVLEAIEAKIEFNRRTSRILESIARAIFKSWFVDFDPVRKKMEGGDPGLPPSLAASVLPTTAPSAGLSGDAWIDGQLADIAELNPETWTDATLPDNVAYIDLSNVKRGRIEQVVHWTREAVPSRARRILRPGDTVVGTVRPGNQSYALITEDGLTGSTGFAVLRPREPEYREIVYLAATARSNIEELASLADGGAYPAVRPETIARSPVLIPPVDSARVFSRLTAPLFDLIAVRELESRSLAVLRDALLPRLLSGELQPEAMADDLVESGDEWLESVVTTDRTAGSS